MRYRVEHYRAVESPGAPLGYEFSPTGRIDEVEAHDAADAATAVLLADEQGALEPVSYDPGRDLFAVPGEDEAVRVSQLA